MSSFNGQNNGQVSNGTTPLCRLAGGKLNDVLSLLIEREAERGEAEGRGWVGLGKR